jgi:hypothetical protein
MGSIPRPQNAIFYEGTLVITKVEGVWRMFVENHGDEEVHLLLFFVIK